MGRGLVAIAVCAAVIASAVGLYRTANRETEFCAAYGNIVQGQVATFGEVTLLTGEPASHRDPCDGDDLWHYMTGDLDGVDGVLFDDCVISWVGGGRSTVAAESIPCEPEPIAPFDNTDT